LTAQILVTAIEFRKRTIDRIMEDRIMEKIGLALGLRSHRSLLPPKIELNFLTK
jgi:hypothetical protein